MTKNELNNKIHELRQLRRMADELAAEIEAITDVIKQQMTTEGVDTLIGDDWKATWKPVQSSRFDSKAFKATMPDLYNRFTRSAETRRFVLV